MAAKPIGILVYTDTESSLATTTLVSSESIDDYEIEVTVLPSSGMSKAVYYLPADAVEISDLFPNLLFSPITMPDTVFLTDEITSTSTPWPGITAVPSLVAVTSGETSIQTSTEVIAEPSVHASIEAIADTSPDTSPEGSAKTSKPSRTVSVSPSTGTPSNPPGSGWFISKGAVAGTVLGVAVIIAALTFILTILYMRHQRRYRRGTSDSLADNPTRYTSLPGYRWDEVEKYTALAELDGSPRLIELDTLPSKPADDNLIRSKTQSFLTGVEAYTGKYFAERKNHKVLGNRNALKGFDTPFLQKALPLLLDQSKQCTLLITQALAHFIIARIQLSYERNESLLPPDFFLAQTVVDRCERNDPEVVQSHSQWRVLTVHLRPDAASKPTYTAHRDLLISQLCYRVLDAFSPWLLSPRSYSDPKNAPASDPACESTGRSTPVQRAEEDESVTGLTALFKEGADLGIFLFAQPSLLEFCWPEVGKGEVVVLPGLEKLQDEQGRKLDVPVRLVEASVKRMDKPR